MGIRNKNRKASSVYTLLFAIGVSLFTYLDFADLTIPYDDAYSMFMVKSSYFDIAKITAEDVHPPLYYWGLKAFSSIFGDTIFSLRLFSALGIFATFLLGYFLIRKHFGDRVALIFISLLIMFPVAQYLATDIRMYSWTMFFVLACAICGYKIYSEGYFRNWVLFLITGLCAAYLHNYALLSVVGIYIFLLMFLVHGKKEWRRLIYCGIIFSALYAPWLLQLIWQFSDVANEYWIEPLTLNDLFLHIYYFYSPKEVWRPFTDFSKIQMMIGLIIVMGIQLLITLKVLRSGIKNRDEKTYLAIISFLVFLFPILIAALISILYVPILASRYMTCSFGLFVLSLAFIFDKAYEYPIYRRLTNVFFVLLIFVGSVRVYSGVKYYNETESLYHKIREFTASNGEKSILLAADSSYSVMPRLQIIVPNNHFYILNRTVDNDFSPFVFQKIDSIPLCDFILVHHEPKEISADFRKYQHQLSERYIFSDSIQALDSYLYKLKLR